MCMAARNWYLNTKLVAMAVSLNTQFHCNMIKLARLVPF